MKKLLLMLMLLCTILCCAFYGCGEEETQKLLDITGITLESATFDYDGSEKKIEITGNLPDGVSVVYTNNNQVNVGDYEVTATLSGGGYNTLTLNAVLKIKGADITGITLESATFDYDGNEKKIEITGNLPDGVSVAYTNNNQVNVGDYEVTATLSGGGYNTLTLNAELKIKGADITGITFESKTYYCDGTSKTLDVIGDTTGYNVVYSPANSYTEKGIYNIVATISKTGYNTLTLSATLTLNLREITGFTFSNSETTFDGSEKNIELSGDTTGYEVQYSPTNSYTDAGSYLVEATISKEFYEPLKLNATLTINKAEFTGYTFDDESLTYDGENHSISVTNLPSGTTVNYSYNDKQVTCVKDIGKYNVVAKLVNKNYIDKEITAVLKIKRNLVNLAKTIIGCVVKMPEPWQFLPDSLKLENKKADSVSLDFTQFVNVSSIPTNGIGKQLNVMYNVLSKLEVGINAIKKVNAVVSTIENLYQTFINNNEDDFAIYEDTQGTIKYKIVFDDKNYTFLASVGSVAVEMYYDCDSQENTGRLQLNNTTAVKYTIKENGLIVALNILNAVTAEVEFVEKDDIIKGYLYEYYTVAGKTIKTTAEIIQDEKYTTIMSNKRETEDLSIEGYAEVYDNETGNYVAGEVKETVKSLNYDTMWFNLNDITGINSVKATDTINGDNLNTIYINGSANAINTKLMGITAGAKALSRRFDIEMKDMYFYVYNEDSCEYEKQCVSIPMMFVGKDYLDCFAEDFYDKNKNNGCTQNATIKLSSDTLSNINSIYTTLLSEYKQVKSVEQSAIIDYIGTENDFFVE